MLPLEIMGFDAAERRERVARYLKLVNLSGSEPQIPLAAFRRHAAARLDRARRLCFEPALLLMDEPSAHSTRSCAIISTSNCFRLWNQTKKTVVFVTHSIPEAVFLSDQDRGDVAAAGPDHRRDQQRFPA